jgi:hypothetical protein
LPHIALLYLPQNAPSIAVVSLCLICSFAFTVPITDCSYLVQPLNLWHPPSSP